MNDKVDIAQEPTGTLVPIFDRKSTPNVQNEFWPNPNFELEEVICRSKSVELLPLTAVIGPHSNRIASTLAHLEGLKQFSGGVDERTVFAPNHLPWGGEFVVWDECLNDRPLVFGHFDRDRDCYEVFCLKISDCSSSQEQIFRIEVVGIVELDTARKCDAFEVFCDPECPIVLKFTPADGSLECDISRLIELAPHDLRDFLSQLSFVAYVLADDRIQKDPIVRNQ